MIEQLWLRLVFMFIDVIADAVHATCPSTGRLATVITTGAAAKPPRSSLRRLSDVGPVMSAESGAAPASVAAAGCFGEMWSDFIVLS